MAQGDLLVVGREAIMTGLMISAPFLVVSLIIGLVISILQAATQIHDQNLVFVPKIIGTAAVVLVLGSWIITIMMNYTEDLFTMIQSIF